MSQSTHKDVVGPYIVWVYYGYEGWQPTSYNTLKEALFHENYGNDFVITKGPVEFIVADSA